MSRPKVVVVGVGALGSHAVLFARNLDATFVLVDFDRVEQKNLLAQFHSKMGLGKNKAVALQAALQGLYGLKVEAVPHRLGDENADALLGGAHLVLDCVDNAPTRGVIQRFVRARAVACLHGALAADGAYARVMWDELFEADGAADGAPTCEDGRHLPFVAAVGGRIAHAAQEFLETGRKRSVHLHPGGVVAVG